MSKLLLGIRNRLLLPTMINWITTKNPFIVSKIAANPSYSPVTGLHLCEFVTNKRNICDLK